MIFSISDSQNKCLLFHYHVCRSLFNIILNVILSGVFMLNVVMLGVAVLNVVMLGVVVLNVVMLCVVVP
jgi:hypothetical protein